VAGESPATAVGRPRTRKTARTPGASLRRRHGGRPPGERRRGDGKMSDEP